MSSESTEREPTLLDDDSCRSKGKVIQLEPGHPSNLTLEEVDQAVKLQLEEDKKVEEPLSTFGERNKVKLSKDLNDEVVETPARNCSNPNCLKPLDWKSNAYLRKDENGVYATYSCYCTECQRSSMDPYRAKNNAKTSAKLCSTFFHLAAKVLSQEKTPEEIERLWDDIKTKEPMRSLLQKESKGSFYLVFARSDRKETEPFMFVSRGSTPILKANGKKITRKNMLENGFSVAALHEERNYIIIGQLEKHAHTDTMNLDLGRRLHKKRGGFPTVKDDCKLMEYGLYVWFNYNGYSNDGNFILASEEKSV